MKKEIIVLPNILLNEANLSGLNQPLENAATYLDEAGEHHVALSVRKAIHIVDAFLKINIQETHVLFKEQKTKKLNLLPGNPTPLDYLRAIRTVESSASLKEIFNLADKLMVTDDELKKEIIATLEWAQQNLAYKTIACR